MNHREGAALASSLSHPIRLELLAALREKSISPVEYSKASGTSLGTSAYHLKVLKKLDVVRVTETIQRRGAIEHRYGPVTGRRWKAVREMMDVLADA